MDLLNVQGINMKKYQSKIKQARKPLISALEPRLLLDGAAVATAVDILTDTQLQSIEDQNTSVTEIVIAPTEVRALDTSLNNGRKEVVFIDSNIENYQTLIEGIDEGIEVQLIDGNQDGLAQMAVWADAHSGYDAIHILSHGSEGQIELGSATLNTESLDVYNAELTLLGESLNEEGDLLLYGCEVSQGDDQNFIEQLSQITGADVAASDDLTGSALLGGDWELENHVGLIDSETIESDLYELTLSDNSAPVFGAASTSTQVSVFSYPNLNGTDSNPNVDNENANLASIIQSVINDGGEYTLDTSIQNFTDNDFEDKLNESGFFFMTDMESGDPNSDAFLPESAQSTIESWVSDGGVIMMTGTAGSYDTSFLNNIFDWDLTTQSGSNWSLNEGNAAGTPFEGGPASLNNPSATDSIGSGTVEGFTAIYGTDDNATVATIEYGAGTIIFLGYDFFNSGEAGTGFTDTATQYGSDVTTGSSNSNDWVQEIVPRALEYSANLANNYVLSANGSQLTLDSDLIVSDSDISDSVTLSVSSVTAVQQTEGSEAVTLSADEAAAYESMLVIANENALDSETSTTTVDWSFDSGNEAFNTLAGNESLVLTYVIEAEDSNGATATTEIQITINGLNDSPDIQVVDVVGTVEEGSSLTDSGSITFTDVDLIDTPTATEATSSVTALAQDGETALALTLAQQAAIEAAFSIENVNTNTNDGTVNWSYNISEANLNFLGQGQVVTAVFTITVTDDEGATDTQDVTITLVGDNDTPVALANLPNIAGTSSLVFDPVSLPNNLFQDADFGETQTLTYSLEGLPDGLIFNANSLTISGVPTSGFEGTNLLQLVATDIYGAQAKIPILLTLESAPVTIDASPDTGSATNVPITGFTAPDINLNIDALPPGTFGDGVDSRGFASESSDSSNGPAEAVAPSSINADASGAVGNQGNIQVFESQVSVNVDANGQVQITQSDSLDQGSNLSVADIVPQEVGVDIKLTDIGIGSSFSATLSDGTDLPSWVEVDPNTGDVFMDPPEGQEKISLKINAIGSDGVTRVLEVEIDLESLPASVATDAIDSDTVTDAKEGHMTFDQQVELAGNEQDNYGSDLMKLLAS